jgi:cyclopropane fatty-acyl-phospholipid synthase-like methyltransferase
MELFKDYAAYYDILYQDKNYQAEVDYVAQLIKQYAPGSHTILELGCGTGTHALILADHDYMIHGIDLSHEMIVRAKEKAAHRHSQSVLFSQGDMRSVKLNQTYDVVLALFHVMSYQTTDSDIRDSFNAVSAHVKPGGLFIFDFWFGPGVTYVSPQVRIKRVDDSDVALTRIAEPTHHFDMQVVDVQYTLFAQHKADGTINQCAETHSMRYFFEPEIQRFCDEYGFDLLVCEEWLSGKTPCKKSWSACVVGRKR